jgi:YD repeat-containing protein
MKFDDNGRVLKDRYDNLYKYDDKGNFIYGLSEKSKMRRDEKGRIVYYENRMDEEDDQGFTLKFEYDENGRMVKTERTGWESTVDQTFTYADNHIYPDRINLESEDEGDHYSTVITYNYKKFDNIGNWTEREIHSVCKHTIDGELEDTTDSKSIEKREIHYYQ